MTSPDTRDLYRGLDDGWTHAMELALTPFVAGGIGYVIDRVIGTVPLLTIAFMVLAVVATGIKMYYAYDARMKAHDAESPWGRARAHAEARSAGARAGAGTGTFTGSLAAGARAVGDRGLGDRGLGDRGLGDRGLGDRDSVDRGPGQP